MSISTAYFDQSYLDRVDKLFERDATIGLPRKINIRALFKELETNLETQKDTLACQLAKNHDIEEILSRISIHIKKSGRIPHHSKEKISRLINEILNLTHDYQAFLKEFGGDVNQVKNEMTPLLKAISDGRIDFIPLLCRDGADPNFYDSTTFPPLHLAIAGNNLRAVEYLVKNGADVELGLKQSEQTTPLYLAILQNHLPIVEFLIKSHAQVNTYTSWGETPLAYAMQKGFSDISKILERAGADVFYAKEFVSEAFVSSIFGTSETTLLRDSSGAVHHANFEGAWPEHISKEVFHHAARFFRENVNFGTSTNHSILTALAEPYPFSSSKEDTINAIKRGQPRFIVGGSDEHTIGMVIYRNRLCICNRGEGRKKDAVEIFDLNDISLTTGALLDILSTKYIDTQSFNKEIEKLKLKKVSGYFQKDQTKDNCSEASTKAAFGALLRLMTNDKTGREIYKQFTGYLRVTSLQKYLTHSEAINKNMLKSIYRKCLRKKEKGWAQECIALLQKYV